MRRKLRKINKSMLVIVTLGVLQLGTSIAGVEINEMGKFTWVLIAVVLGLTKLFED